MEYNTSLWNLYLFSIQNIYIYIIITVIKWENGPGEIPYGANILKKLLKVGPIVIYVYYMSY